jgi:hypothetical protein
MDWRNWHDKYDNPGSGMAQRLEVVQTQIRAALSSSPPGALQVVSLCSGQGRDLLEVLVDHPRRDDVSARLVELDARNTALCEKQARATGLHQIEIVTGDASIADQYKGMVPADLVLICGVFGNITDEDIERTIDACPQLCRSGGIVIWTRHREAPDRVPMICERFKNRGFDLQWLSDEDAKFGVGVHRFTGETQTLVSGFRMFKFVGYDVLRHRT